MSASALHCSTDSEIQQASMAIQPVMSLQCLGIYGARKQGGSCQKTAESTKLRHDVDMMAHCRSHVRLERAGQAGKSYHNNRDNYVIGLPRPSTDAGLMHA